MQGLMQTQPLLISTILRMRRATTRGEIVSQHARGHHPPHHLRRGEARARRLARVLHGSASRRATASARWPGTAIATWKSTTPPPAWARSATPSTRGCIPTTSPTSSTTPATPCCSSISASALLETVAPKIKDCVRAIVMLTDAAQHAGGRAAAPACALHCYDDLMDEADDDYAGPASTEHRQRAVLHLRHHRAAEGRAVQPPLDRAACLCGRPAGRARHACHRPHPAGRADVPRQCLGHPLRAALAGAALVLPGRHLDGASLPALLNAERVTFTCGVPTVWLGLLAASARQRGRLDTVRAS